MLYKWLVIGCVLSLVPVWVFSLMDGAIEWVCLPGICLMQIGLMYRSRDMQPFMILTIYLFLYAAYLAPHFLSGARLSEWWEFQDRHLFREVLLQFYVFYVGMATAALGPMNPGKRRMIDCQDIRVSKGTAIFFALTVIALVTLMYRTGENVLLADNPYEAYTSNGKSASFLIMLTIAATICLGVVIRPYRAGKWVMTALFIALSYYMVTRGYRILLTTVMLGVFVLYLENRFKTRTILAGCGIAVVGFLLLNIAKGGAELEWDSLFNTGSGEVILSHHADNLYGTAAMNGLVENGTVDLLSRIGMGLSWLSHAIVPPSLTPMELRVPQFAQLYTPIGGGSLAPVVAWLFWSYIGCFLFPILVVRFLASAYEGKGGRYKRLIALIVLSTGCNWLSYDFHIILRVPVLACLICWIAGRIDMGWILLTEEGVRRLSHGKNGKQLNNQRNIS